MEQIQVYSNDIVEDNPIAHQGFISTLAEIAARDYKGNDYQLSCVAKALDIDKYERNQSVKPDKTVDAVIGIAKCSNGKVSDERLLLVEIRLGYKGNGENSKSSNMKMKEKHTRGLLTETKVDERCYFIFGKDVAPLRRNQHQRELNVDNSIKHWQIVNPEEFNNEFHENPPKYQIVTPVESILQDVYKKIENCGFDTILSIIKHWQEKEEQYINMHNLIESDAIQQMICKILDIIRPYIDEKQSEEIQFEFMLREERCAGLANRFC